ncbi:MAG: proline iminopeptidase [Nocardia sp.]|uniref:nitroreductase/quinone reductase family protein n=1 Tax=Nocardia sp. TaxID=1821 RepID=UPI00260C21C9|nr:nitroreductase/quinone reductase family protein [Nocardia sp.]MCU1647871.1 proline iminopeptidase [Nocardia sp.]
MTSASQRNALFIEPSRDELVEIGRRHVAGMEVTDAAEVWISSDMEFLLLHTIGRRSGQTRKAALPFWYDSAGCRVIVASLVGAPQHPAWYLNLTAADVNPKVLVRLRSGQYWAEPQILEGVEYQQLWDELTADREFYRDYQSRCARRIPLIRLPAVAEDS